MGFCQRCGDITRGKCTKCGGRSVESTISCLVSEMGGVSIVDKWQSQYACTILAPEEIVKKSQSTKRIPTAQSAFYTVNSRKVCSCCSKTLYHTTILQDNVPYCKECHLKLYNQGHCPSCTQPISENDAWIEHDKKKWHKHCFACFSCKKPLEVNPLVDLQNRPCCETCFMSQAGKRTYNDDSLSSNSSLSSVSSTRSSILLSKYNHSRPRLDSDLFQSLSTPPLTRTPSPEDSPLPKRLESCGYCHQTIDDERKLKLKLSTGQYVWFHRACFLCSQCHLPFDQTECATDGRSVFHSHCDPQRCFGCKKSISEDAYKFLDKVYHFSCFTCKGGCNQVITLGQPFFEVNDLPCCATCEERPRTRLGSRLGGSKSCPRCKETIAIMDDTPGPLASRWHRKCLKCAKCEKQLDSAAQVRYGSKGESLVYCRTCCL
ncbi:unnamed protein product [Rhizopus stolonifer]